MKEALHERARWAPAEPSPLFPLPAVRRLQAFRLGPPIGRPCWLQLHTAFGVVVGPLGRARDVTWTAGGRMAAWLGARTHASKSRQAGFASKPARLRLKSQAGSGRLKRQPVSSCHCHVKLWPAPISPSPSGLPISLPIAGCGQGWGVSCVCMGGAGLFHVSADELDRHHGGHGGGPGGGTASCNCMCERAWGLARLRIGCAIGWLVVKPRAGG